MPTIYADMLYAINFFITLMLIFLTGKLIKYEAAVWRCMLGAAVGGVYSLTILAPELSFFVTYFGKLLSALVIVLASFGFHSVKRYIKAVLIFFFSNLVLLGGIVGIWLVFKPKGIVINNSAVYFDVGARILLLSALIAYLIAALAVRVHNHYTAKKDIFDLTVEYGDKSVHLFAFADSGNSLKEPFSDYPVIIARKNLFEGVICDRVIPYNTVGGEGMLTAFKPKSVSISLSGRSVVVTNVYIALSDNIGGDSFSAILNPKIITL